MADLLNFYKFPGDEIPIIRGSALAALQGTNEEIGKKAILNLMDAVDKYIPDPVRQLDKPFLMPIEDVFSIQVKSHVLAVVGQSMTGGHTQEGLVLWCFIQRLMDITC